MVAYKTKKCLITLILWGLYSCQSSEQKFTPKPKGYNRIELQVPKYQLLKQDHPYSFEYSTQAKVLPDTFALAEPHWIFIYYPAFKASIQLTYKSVLNDAKRLSNMINDAHKLTAKHNVKAYSIEDFSLKTPSGKIASITELTGEVPSPFQFYITDSTTHFLRGALYFNTATQNDSLAPVIDFLKKDAIHLLNTLQWQKKK